MQLPSEEKQNIPVGQANPRVWPLFVVVLLVFLATIVVQLILAGILAVIEISREGSFDAESMVVQWGSAPMVVMNLFSTFLCMVGGALLFGRLSARRAGCSLADRLGLRWPSFSVFSLVGFLLGSVPVLMLSLVAVYLVTLLLPPITGLSLLYDGMTTPWAIVFIIAIGVFPGVGEELLFRGYMQRRLLQRSGPWVGIGVTSVVFGLVHVTPQGIVLATIIGVWLGLLAWRTNSIWPSACCHAVINSGWNFYQIGMIHEWIPRDFPVWFSVIGGLVVLVAFVVSIGVLWKMKPGAPN
ncbi:MAG: CPBP family intramembrane metalloprotease [Mariniblastus sp.]|nr:CPBP family intramembrane metalloprotease [Mariniblastus sp.]